MADRNPKTSPLTPESGQLDVQVPALVELCGRYQVRELLLFGSGARGTLRESSDVDLLVEFEPEAVVGLLRFHQLQQELERLFGRPVDLVPKRGLNPAIRNAVLAEARVLHAA